MTSRTVKLHCPMLSELSELSYFDRLPVLWFHHVPPPLGEMLGSWDSTEVNAFRAGLNDVFPFNELKDGRAIGEQVLGDTGDTDGYRCFMHSEGLQPKAILFHHDLVPFFVCGAVFSEPIWFGKLYIYQKWGRMGFVKPNWFNGQLAIGNLMQARTMIQEIWTS